VDRVAIHPTKRRLGDRGGVKCDASELKGVYRW